MKIQAGRRKNQQTWREVNWITKSEKMKEKKNEEMQRELQRSKKIPFCGPIYA